MSSPPPTTPSALLPRKRPSISSTASGQAKRPRMHPLRQTSFPTGMGLEYDNSRSRAPSDAGSVTGSFTGSLGGTSSVFDGPKKRGRKKKADKEREDASIARGGAADGRSTRVGSADIDGGSVRGGAGGGNEEAAEEEEEQDMEGDMLGGTEGFLDVATEKKNLAVLTGSFTPLQADRYEKWNRTRLRKETLRRIVNHALSQSVPQSVVTVVNGFTKVFIGEIIEKARTVQEEWAEAFDLSARVTWEREQAELETAAAAKAAAEAEAKAREEAKAKEDAKAREEAQTNSGSASAESKESDKTTTAMKSEPQSPPGPNNIPALPSAAGFPTTHLTPYASTPNAGQLANGMKMETHRTFIPPVNPHRGQLLPDHIREALRRYKRDGEGGGTGMSGLSQPMMGVRGAFSWQAGPGGRRLFR
ncbi:transcription initiation factor TFIID subunit beta, putative [Talaromyces stipitatus ATCC 10500]|uniref:Transcription initiation factor TFIID subunit beta, putative n=1 Tax=Talaromyces stipitatus (strain ATCC 10500 / CBS 375.48 / QM 6759 / NRRL 1006) TaxID=441959 RepID=B8MDL9_TALSN|nr:transcription initiation factor TFIID subunit beta, putative [Talaromyces stipitatus ATCC 10500]EED17982.1 transcription initiation factor TFIID subunit beta, putative [Talaromyces stipitatus ATCC 10500]